MKLTGETLQYIALFENITHAHVKDCILRDDILYFVVAQGYVQRALGKNNVNLERLSHLLKKPVRLISYHADPARFIKNVLYPIKVDAITVEGSLIRIHVADQRLKGKVFGRERENLAWVTSLTIKYFPTITEVHVV